MKRRELFKTLTAFGVVALTPKNLVFKSPVQFDPKKTPHENLEVLIGGKKHYVPVYNNQVEAI